MKKTLAIAQGFALLVFLAAPRSTPAKAATVKIIVSGPDLPAPLEITDQQILDLSNVWAGQFLDASHGSLEKPPQRLPYELTFYVELGEKNLRLMYVAYYYPDPSSSKQGFLYLPGKSEPWYYLNVGTILRENQDGRWSYATPAWEALIKPVIARAARRVP